MYFGSVRFFKNMILLVVIILILIPTVAAIRNGDSLAEMENEIARLTAEVENARRQSAEQMSLLAAVPPEPEEEEEEAEEEKEFTARQMAYQALYPDFYAPVTSEEWVSTDGVIYLTFDDGPSANTDRILEILGEEQIEATFFVNGSDDEEALQRMRDIVDQGHTLGMHSYAHQYRVIYESVEAFLDDMYRIFVLIRDTTGQAPVVFRFPGGSINSYNRGLYQEMLAEMMRRGFVPHDWNLSAQDATSPILSTDQIIRNVLSNAAEVERGIVLMHDDSQHYTTVQALSTIISRLRELGFTFDRIRPDTQPVLFSYKD